MDLSNLGNEVFCTSCKIPFERLVKTKRSGWQIYEIIKVRTTEHTHLAAFPKAILLKEKPKKEHINTNKKPMLVGIKRPMQRPCNKASKGILKVLFSL